MLRRPLRFNCFSPPVMLATFVVEICLLTYTVVRYKMNVVTRIAAALLFFLALFQLAEYNVCGRLGINAATWSRIGFISITILPALGIHLIQVISGRKWRAISRIAYLTALVWILVFAFSDRVFDGYACTGNYVIFQLNPSAAYYYYNFYYGWLLFAIGLAFYLARGGNRKIRHALLWIVAGYLVFLFPTTLANTVNPDTKAGVPSIMCGFAVLFALILTFGVLPRVIRPKTSRKRIIDKK